MWLSETRQADLGLDDGDGLGELLLVRRTFGPEILPLWRWKDSSNIAGGDRVAEIRLGQVIWNPTSCRFRVPPLGRLVGGSVRSGP